MKQREQVMSKKYRVVIKGTQQEVLRTVDVAQGTGEAGQPVRIKAALKEKYVLQDLQREGATAPEQLQVKRVGKHLRVAFDGSLDADLIIEDYFEVTADQTSALIGQAEDGVFYEYVPENRAASQLLSSLSEQGEQISMALGQQAAAVPVAVVGGTAGAAGSLLPDAAGKGTLAGHAFVFTLFLTSIYPVFALTLVP